MCACARISWYTRVAQTALQTGASVQVHVLLGQGVTRAVRRHQSMHTRRCATLQSCRHVCAHACLRVCVRTCASVCVRVHSLRWCTRIQVVAPVPRVCGTAHARMPKYRYAARIMCLRVVARTHAHACTACPCMHACVPACARACAHMRADARTRAGSHGCVCPHAHMNLRMVRVRMRTCMRTRMSPRPACRHATLPTSPACPPPVHPSVLS